jgi:hypothetical protein
MIGAAIRPVSQRGAPPSSAFGTFSRQREKGKTCLNSPIAAQAVAAAPAVPPPDSKAQAILAQLDDIVTPPPPDWWPHTWGWVALGVVLLAFLIWVAWRALKRYSANRYRREALVELARIEAQLRAPGTRATALAALPSLLKRTALAAWPRAEVARLSGTPWRDFLSAQTRAAIDPAAQRLLDDLEYRGADALRAIPENDALAATRAVRRWIESHRATTRVGKGMRAPPAAGGRTRVPA